MSAPATARPRRPPIDPRIRQRRAAVTRQRGRRRLRLVAVGLGLAVLIGVSAWVLHSSLLAARHVTVRGAQHTAVQAVLSASGLDRHPPLIDIDPPSAVARIEALPWVETAVVARHWPDSVTVTVTERRPVADVTHPGGVAVVDGTGRVLEWTAALPGLPVLAGPGRPGRTGAPGTSLPRSYRPGLVVLGGLPATLQRRVADVDVGAGGQVTLGLGGGVSAVLGPADELAAKFEALASVLAGAPPAGPEVIDVTVPDEPTVAPGGTDGAGSSPTASPRS